MAQIVSSLYQDIPVAIVFKAMGFECEQEFVQMIGSEEEILVAIAPGLEECHRAQVFSQLQVSYHFICELDIKLVCHPSDQDINWRPPVQGESPPVQVKEPYSRSHDYL